MLSKCLALSSNPSTEKKKKKSVINQRLILPLPHLNALSVYLPKHLLDLPALTGTIWFTIKYNWCFYFPTDNCLPAVRKICGLVGVRCPVVWNASRTGNVSSHFHVSCDHFSLAQVVITGPDSVTWLMLVWPPWPGKEGEIPLESGYIQYLWKLSSGHKQLPAGKLEPGV
jgi:hypothetical protein